MSLEEKIVKIEKTLEQIDKRLKRIESEVRSLGCEVTVLENEIAILRDELDANFSSITKLIIGLVVGVLTTATLTIILLKLLRVT